MTTLRAALALALAPTLPVYLGACLFPGHAFAAEWEREARRLLGLDARR